MTQANIAQTLPSRQHTPIWFQWVRDTTAWSPRVNLEAVAHGDYVFDRTMLPVLADEMLSEARQNALRAVRHIARWGCLVTQRRAPTGNGYDAMRLVISFGRNSKLSLQTDTHNGMSDFQLFGHTLEYLLIVAGVEAEQTKYGPRYSACGVSFRPREYFSEILEFPNVHFITERVTKRAI